MRRALAIASLLILGACADRTDAPYVTDVPDSATKVTVLTITNRDTNEAGNFSSDRAAGARYFNNTVAIPAAHKPGEIELSYRNPDPEAVFVIERQDPLASKTDFARALRAELAKQKNSAQEVIVFVHGYNSSYTDGVFRSAQLVKDLEVPGVMVNYSWPSAANPLGYSHDRDSMLFARDNFQTALELIHQETSVPILIVAHSMGALLAMETLRQMEIEKPGWSNKALGGVALISPDISLDVFKLQAARFKTLPQPFAIFVSQKDPILSLSARVNAVSERLGNVGSAENLADLPVTLIDVTQFSGRGLNQHFVPGTSPALISILKNSLDVGSAFESDVSGRSGFLPGVALNVREATQIVLSPLLEGPV